MKPFFKGLIFAAFALSAQSASACTISAAKVIGYQNFADLTVSGCAQTSMFLKGSHSLADIINRFGTLVTGIYGNNHFYKVRIDGHNRVAILVDGNWHRTDVRVKGHGNEVTTRQSGPNSSSLEMELQGDFNTVDLNQTGGGRFKGSIVGSGNTFKLDMR